MIAINEVALKKSHASSSLVGQPHFQDSPWKWVWPARLPHFQGLSLEVGLPVRLRFLWVLGCAAHSLRNMLTVRCHVPIVCPGNSVILATPLVIIVMVCNKKWVGLSTALEPSSSLQTAASNW